eukprot:GDKH01008797.1.p2 GENE.GDKH01008797.1~~GDKH01008797.1.p2  ORF type:complete len:98 (+),score=4.06 GDKH01008797.1:146-439(+)
MSLLCCGVVGDIATWEVGRQNNIFMSRSSFLMCLLSRRWYSEGFCGGIFPYYRGEVMIWAWLVVVVGCGVVGRVVVVVVFWREQEDTPSNNNMVIRQ